MWYKVSEFTAKSCKAFIYWELCLKEVIVIGSHYQSHKNVGIKIKLVLGLIKNAIWVEGNLWKKYFQDFANKKIKTGFNEINQKRKGRIRTVVSEKLDC